MATNVRDVYPPGWPIYYQSPTNLWLEEWARLDHIVVVSEPSPLWFWDVT